MKSSADGVYCPTQLRHTPEAVLTLDSEKDLSVYLGRPVTLPSPSRCGAPNVAARSHSEPDNSRTAIIHFDWESTAVSIRPSSRFRVENRDKLVIGL